MSFLCLNSVLFASDEKKISGVHEKIYCEDFLYPSITPKVVQQIWDPNSYLEFLEEHRAAYRVQFKNERVYDSKGRLYSTLKAYPPQQSIRAIWFMAPDGAFYVTTRSAHSRLTHSVFASYGPIAAAGEVIITEGVIRYINDDAPTYDLDRRQFREAYLSLTNKLGWRYMESAMVDYLTAYPKSQIIGESKWRRK